MYRLKLAVSSCTAQNRVVEDHEPRSAAFWGDKLNWLLDNGFLEEVKEESKKEDEDPQKEEVKEELKKKKGV